MQCKECGFMVPQNLKFAIIKNFCPQCGTGLFSQKEMSQLSMIQSRLSSQMFASSFTEETIYDISLFIFNEISNGFGRVMLDEQIQRELARKNEALEGDVSDSNNFDEEEAERIREQVRNEVVSSAGIVSEDEDLDEKVKRLKDAYAKTKKTFKNPVIRRSDS